MDYSQLTTANKDKKHCLASPVKLPSLYFVFFMSFLPLEDNRITLQLITARHRKRLRESRLHSYTFDEDDDEEDAADEDNHNSGRNAFKERMREQNYNREVVGIDKTPGEFSGF